MAITIQSASMTDIPALVDLLGILFAIEQDFTPDPTAQQRGLELLLKHPERGQILLACDESAGVIGMVSAQLVISTAVGAPSAWIEDMVIAPSYRGQGLGKQLLAAAADWARQQGAQRLQLLADADNAPALEFYQHLGWQSTRLYAWKQLL